MTAHCAKDKYSTNTSRPLFSSFKNSCTQLQERKTKQQLVKSNTVELPKQEYSQSNIGGARGISNLDTCRFEIINESMPKNQLVMVHVPGTPTQRQLQSVFTNLMPLTYRKILPAKVAKHHSGSGMRIKESAQHWFFGPLSPCQPLATHLH